MAVSEKPLPPADDDCCGGGACNPCVWDHYYAELKKWRLAQAELKAQQEQSQESAPESK
ncbi:oxidoreductase-like domain-containing protein [Thalassotalea sp. PLHSN55]|uniref:oxidoreductase-like domain-containing protein n=1 Tax=Thalassotalea sp. PLHSN55 TaxID=3435888 RepID=UPI003F829C91